MKNTLIQYKGGGYDGCFWEWNFCYFDKDGIWHDIYSSGTFGCDSLPKLSQFISGNGGHLRVEEKNEDYFLFNLNRKNDIKNFTEESQASQVVYIAKWLDEKFDITLKGKCNICETEINLESAFTVNPKHYGGIAYSNADKVCEECYCGHSCAYCGEFWDDNGKFNQDGYCEYCQEKN